MEKISCNVIQDILPLYLDDMASDDTRALVEEHLKGCESCRKLYQETEREILSPVDIREEKQETKELQNFKKFLSRKRIKSAVCAVLAVMLLFAGLIVYLNRHIVPISYEDAGITIYEDNEAFVCYETGIRGNYHWKASVDRKTGVCTISFEQSLWEKYVDCLFHPFDHIHNILKKDQIQQIYLNPDGTTATIWEATEEEKEAYFSNNQAPLG